MPRSLDRPGQPPLPDQPDATDVPGRLGLPERADQRALAGPEEHAGRWSKADLRQRLDRLPPGHPSSPRADARTPDHEADAIKQDYWSEVPRFRQAWEDHVRRWPAERSAAAVDRTRDPAGSWRGDGNQYLNPEQHAQVNNEIEDVKRREETITKRLQEVAQSNSWGGQLEGLAFRCKGDDRLKEKVAQKIQAEPDRTSAEVMREINDAIRYTFCLEPSNYANGYLDLKRQLESSGYRMTYSKNHWRDNPEYKGINTRWVTPDDQLFEVQFHTPESYHAKQEVTHGAYERARNPLTGRSERREIEVFHKEVCAFITVPSQIESIPDYKEESN